MRQVILSYGGGVDSTALVVIDANRDQVSEYLGIERSELDSAFPPFDKAVFADTGAEFAVTYKIIDRVAELLGDRLCVTRKAGETIFEWCKRLGTVPVLPGGSHICSMKFKGDVLAAWAKAEGIMQPVWQIGIEADEGRRVKRFSAPKDGCAEYRYPLVELGLTRQKLDRLLVDMGWCGVHKSSCFFCPFMSEEELKDMYLNHQEEWAKAVEIEDGFREASNAKHQAWLDAGKPTDAAGRALRGMWKRDSWAEGARLFVKQINGRRLSVREWGKRFESGVDLHEWQPIGLFDVTEAAA
jgi:hypothetical protein